MTFSISTRQNRTREWTVTLFESDGTTEIVLAADDVVRLKVGSNGETPLLDLSNIEASGNGSTITPTVGTGRCNIKIAQADIRTLFGAYDCEILVVDDSENLPGEEKAIKHAEYGVLFVHPSQGGEIAEEQSSSSQSESESSASSSLNSSSSSSS